MLHQLLDFANSVRGEITRLERFPDSRSALLDLLVRRSDRPRAAPILLRVKAQDVREFKILFPQEIDALALTQRHPLLWSHQQDELELYVQGEVADPHGILGRLQARHETLAHGWIPFEACLNAAAPPHQILASGSGMLARGPQTLITAYQEVLAAGGARCSVLSRGSFADADVEDGPRVLLLGKSFIVATMFDAEQVPAAT